MFLRRIKLPDLTQNKAQSYVRGFVLRYKSLCLIQRLRYIKTLKDHAPAAGQISIRLGFLFHKRNALSHTYTHTFSINF